MPKRKLLIVIECSQAYSIERVEFEKYLNAWAYGETPSIDEYRCELVSNTAFDLNNMTQSDAAEILKDM